MTKLRWITKAGGVFLLWALAAIALPAQTLTTLVNFDGSNGAGPDTMALVQGTDGNLYGTTTTGGAQDYGTVFRITPSGTLPALYSFCAERDCANGASPYEGLVLATDGNFYGTTTYGGANGWGTVFRITPEG